MNNLLVRFTSILILGVTWVITWQHILYADKLPGDGFTGGIFILIVVLLQFVVLGQKDASRRLPQKFFYWTAFSGLTLLFCLLFFPLAWGGAPLEHFYVPLGYGKLSSTTLFDLGIFLAIGGSLVTSLTSLKEPVP